MAAEGCDRAATLADFDYRVARWSCCQSSGISRRARGKLVVSVSYMDIGWNREDSLASPVSRIDLLCFKESNCWIPSCCDLGTGWLGPDV